MAKLSHFSNPSPGAELKQPDFSPELIEAFKSIPEGDSLAVVRVARSLKIPWKDFDQNFRLWKLRQTQQKSQEVKPQRRIEVSGFVCRCGHADLVGTLCDSGPHFGRIDCPSCDRWVRWIPKPRPQA